MTQICFLFLLLAFPAAAAADFTEPNALKRSAAVTANAKPLSMTRRKVASEAGSDLLRRELSGSLSGPSSSLGGKMNVVEAWQPMIEDENGKKASNKPDDIPGTLKNKPKAAGLLGDRSSASTPEGGGKLYAEHGILGKYHGAEHNADGTWTVPKPEQPSVQDGTWGWEEPIGGPNGRPARPLYSDGGAGVIKWVWKRPGDYTYVGEHRRRQQYKHISGEDWAQGNHDLDDLSEGSAGQCTCRHPIPPPHGQETTATPLCKAHGEEAHWHESKCLDIGAREDECKAAGNFCKFDISATESEGISMGAKPQARMDHGWYAVARGERPEVGAS